MVDEFEQVFTVRDWYDGPREGIANYKGQPHYYIFLNEEFIDEDNWLTLFHLKPIDQKTFALALKSWEIWLRWEKAFQENRTPLETHPALPEDRERSKIIDTILEDKLRTDETTFTVYGKFKIERQIKGKEEIKCQKVKWTMVNKQE
jgi:hypothetical protein